MPRTRAGNAIDLGRQVGQDRPNQNGAVGMKSLIALGLATALAGCQQVRGTGERWMSDAEIEAKDNGVCQSLGAVRGTQSYVDCRLRLRSDRSAEDRLRRFSPD